MIKEIKKLIKEYELDGILIIDQFEVLKLLNVQKSYNFFEFSPLLLITEERDYLFVDRFSFEELKEYKDFNIILTEDIFISSKKLVKIIKEIINKEKIKTLGLFDELTINGVKIKRIPNPFIDSFTILNEEKIKIMKECIDISKKIYEDIKDKISMYETEIDLRNRIDKLIYEYDAEKRAYPTRVISGKRTSNPNSITEGNIIEYPLIIDFGLIKRNIGIGISRTFLNEEYKELLNKAIDIEKEIIDFIKPGRMCSKIYDYYLNISEKMGIKDFLYGPISKPLPPYSKGIYISSHNDTMIQPDSYFQINIELYKPPEFGIKIIDVVEVKDKTTNLTEFY